MSSTYFVRAESQLQLPGETCRGHSSAHAEPNPRTKPIMSIFIGMLEVKLEGASPSGLPAPHQANRDGPEAPVGKPPNPKSIRYLLPIR
jgi:hypothetical protein